MITVDHFSLYLINFGGSRWYSFFTRYTKCHALWSTSSKCLRAFQYLLESVQNYSVAYIFHYVWSSLEIICISFIVLLLENSKLFYLLLLFCLCIEITRCLKLVQMLDSNQMFVKSTGDTPDFLTCTYQLVNSLNSYLMIFWHSIYIFQNFNLI